MSGHDPRYDRWDAAYVLGALSSADRLDFEEHLGECLQCRNDVAELGGLPGLLSRIPTDRAQSLVAGGESATGSAAGRTVAQDLAQGAGDPSPPADLAERLHRRTRHRRIRALALATGTAVAAAVLAVVGVLGIQSITGAPSQTADLSPTHAVPGGGEQLSATVRLYTKKWGTEVDTRCSHEVAAQQAGESAGSGYGLFVVDSTGADTLVSSWRGIPESPIETTAATATPIAQMQRLELRSLPDQTVLLRAPVRH